MAQLPNYQEFAENAILSCNLPAFTNIVGIAPSNYEDWDWDVLACMAVSSGIIQLVRAVMSLAPSDHKWEWDDIASFALINGNIERFMWVLSIAPINYRIDFNNVACNVARSGNTRLMNFVHSMAPMHYQWDWFRIFRAALGVSGREMCLCIGKLSELPEIPE
jgi:hypothetical protein